MHYDCAVPHSTAKPLRTASLIVHKVCSETLSLPNLNSVTSAMWIQLVHATNLCRGVTVTDYKSEMTAVAVLFAFSLAAVAILTTFIIRQKCRGAEKQADAHRQSCFSYTLLFICMSRMLVFSNEFALLLFPITVALIIAQKLQ